MCVLRQINVLSIYLSISNTEDAPRPLVHEAGDLEAGQEDAGGEDAVPDGLSGLCQVHGEEDFFPQGLGGKRNWVILVL